MANIRIPTPLRSYTGGNAQIEVNGPTVQAALNDLMSQYPQLEPHLYDSGALRSFVNVFLGEEDIRYLDGMETAIDEGDRLMIIPSIAGGNS
jgi:molybdopterin converting factor small subunit